MIEPPLGDNVDAEGSHQHIGYKKGMAIDSLTVTGLRNHLDEVGSWTVWYSGLGLGQSVDLVFVDLKKAFDIVDHQVLCLKLVHYGVKSCELSWHKS